MNKKQLIKTISTHELQQIISESYHLTEVFTKLQIPINNGVYRRLFKERIAIDNIPLNFLIKEKKTSFKKRYIPSNEELFVSNSTTCRTVIKSRILKYGLIEYRCIKCGITDKWQGQSISLHLDHINGIPDDNRLENLRFLCPNCHSQTNTYSGKNVTTRLNKQTHLSNACLVCDKKISHRSTHCNIHAALLKRRFNPTKEELTKLVNLLPMTKIAKHFGVSDNAVRKRCMKLGILI